jgi:hypothetical protein
MSNGPQVSPAIAYAPRLFETNSSIRSKPKPTAIFSPSVLLVGRSLSWESSVLKSLAKFGSELSFAAPKTVTSKYAKKGGYDLILLDSTVSPEQRRQLASELAGSTVSIFYTFPVENGCWWLPTLREGQDCHGAPAFRRNEFPLELERLLRDQTTARLIAD